MPSSSPSPRPQRTPGPPRRSRFYGACQRILTATLPRWLEVRCTGRERVPAAGGVLVISNHQSVLDPVLLALYLERDCDFMARENLFHRHLFRRLIVALNAFPVRRDAADIAAIREGLRRLRAGRLLVTFPEGTRSGDGRIAPLRPGAVVLAQRGGVPVVPAVIEGLIDIWPRRRRWPGRGTCWLEYGEPLAPQQLRGRRPAEVAAELTDVLRGLHNDLRLRAGRPPFTYNEGVRGT